MGKSRRWFNPDEKLFRIICALKPSKDVFFKYNEVIYRVWRRSVNNYKPGDLAILSFPKWDPSDHEYREYKRHYVNITEQFGNNFTLKDVLSLADLLQVAEIHEN